MALINGIIQQQNYELIRDRLGEILAVELANQTVLTGTEFVKAVDIERLIPYDETDYPVINVVFNNGDYSNKQQTQSDGYYKYFIVGYVKAKTNNSERGDKLATNKLHKFRRAALDI